MVAERNQSGADTAALQEELEQFRKEKEKIRQLVGQIGGIASSKRDRFMNSAFMLAIGLLLIGDLLRHVLHLPISLPALFSIELGILLVSIKIIWMIHRQSKVEHFQFWILNSIEFRLNEVTKLVRQIERTLDDGKGAA
jgi:hypothetical protein